MEKALARGEQYGMGGRRLPDRGHYAKVTNGMHIFMKAESFVQGLFQAQMDWESKRKPCVPPMGAGALAKVTSFIIKTHIRNYGESNNHGGR